MHKYFKKIDNTNYISEWKPKGLSDEVIKPPFGGSCLEQDKITFNHGKIVNICTIYEISVADSNDNYPTLEKCVFGAVK